MLAVTLTRYPVSMLTATSAVPALKRSAEEDMKYLPFILVSLILASCSPKKVDLAHPDSSPATILASLQQELSNATITVEGIERDIDIRWMSRSHALMCQRQLDIYLGDNQMGAFVNPSDQVTVDAFTEQLKMFLQRHRVTESHIWNKKPEIINKY